MSAIKLNNDKIEVINTVSQPSPDQSAINDKFDIALKDQNHLFASVIARLEKVEGKTVSSSTNDMIPRLDLYVWGDAPKCFCYTRFFS